MVPGCPGDFSSRSGQEPATRQRKGTWEISISPALGLDGVSQRYVMMAGFPIGSTEQASVWSGMLGPDALTEEKPTRGLL